MRPFLAVAALSLPLATAVWADLTPAEAPPKAFAGRQYTDSLGCVFQRAVRDGVTYWLPLFGADGLPVCKGGAKAEAKEKAAEPQAKAKPAADKPVPKKAKPKRKAHKARPAPALLAGSDMVGRDETLCLPGSARAARYWITDGRRVTVCNGALAEDGPAFLNSLGAPGLAVKGQTSDPAALDRAKAKGANGYRLTWSNGPLVGTPDPVAPAGRYWVQVGAFAEAANADAAVARVAAGGFGAARLAQRGGHLTAILAGPFASAADAEAARATLRAAGFGGAFLRR